MSSFFSVFSFLLKNYFHLLFGRIDTNVISFRDFLNLNLMLIFPPSILKMWWGPVLMSSYLPAALINFLKDLSICPLQSGQWSSGLEVQPIRKAPHPLFYPQGSQRLSYNSHWFYSFSIGESLFKTTHSENGLQGTISAFTLQFSTMWWFQ